MLAMVSSWLTPTLLFVTINLVIATIVVISRFTNRNSPQSHQHGGQNSPQLTRAPTLLNRVKSFNFSFHSFDVHSHSEDLYSARSAQLARAPSILNRLMSGKFSVLDRSEQAPKSETEMSSPNEPETQQAKSNQETAAREGRGTDLNSGGDFLAKPPQKMMKSASEKLGKSDVEERDEIEKRRPSTVRVGKMESAAGGEIDAKADDFIYKFKQQLKLQRLDSLLRYRDMLTGK